MTLDEDMLAPVGKQVTNPGVEDTIDTVDLELLKESLVWYGVECLTKSPVWLRRLGVCSPTSGICHESSVGAVTRTNGLL